MLRTHGSFIATLVMVNLALQVGVHDVGALLAWAYAFGCKPPAPTMFVVSVRKHGVPDASIQELICILGAVLTGCT